jgi:hypothetical protein
VYISGYKNSDKDDIFSLCSEHLCQEDLIIKALELLQVFSKCDDIERCGKKLTLNIDKSAKCVSA